MKAYAYDNLPGDGRLAHDDSGRAPPIPLPLLAATLNIHAQHLPLLADVDAIARAEHYTQRDEITISAAALGGADQYEAKRAVFFAEHLHDDDEIRYVLAGAGFFDVRDRADAWVRVRVERGDLLRLPAGIYHRFSPDEGDYIKAMRLFREEPKWTPLMRCEEVDRRPCRTAYLETVGKGKGKGKGAAGEGEADEGDEHAEQAEQGGL